MLKQQTAMLPILTVNVVKTPNPKIAYVHIDFSGLDNNLDVTVSLLFLTILCTHP